MLIRRPDAMDGVPMQMEDVRGVEMRLMVGRGDGAPTFAMRHFTVAPGGHTPRHSHNYEHEVFILAGRGTVEEDGAINEISAGDALFVRPRVTHQFRNTGAEPLAFLCFVPVQFDCGDGSRGPTPGS